MKKLFKIYSKQTGELDHTSLIPVNNEKFYSREIIAMKAPKNFAV